MDIPDNIVLDELPGPTRSKWPALFFRDEIIWSPDHTYFALAYSIAEASMNNEIGCLLWGATHGSQAHILANPLKVHATCWSSPWCRWIDQHTFLFKAQALRDNRICCPNVALHVHKGFQMIRGTNTNAIWIDANANLSDVWIPFAEERLLEQILKST